MLCLNRKENQTLKIGDDVYVHIVHIRGNQVKVGIVAPGDVRVLRLELLDEPAIGTLNARQRSDAGDEADALAYQNDRRLAEERDAAEWQRWAEAAV